MPDLERLRRVLIIRLSSIGDVTHALPVSAALGEAFPHLQITWIVEEMSAEIVTGNPYLHDVIVIPRSRWKQGRAKSPTVWGEYVRFLAALRRRRFDVVIDLQGYAKSAILALATGARYRLAGWHMHDGAALVSARLPSLPTSIHRVDRFLDSARALGASAPRVTFPLHIPDDAHESADRVLGEAGIGGAQAFAVLNPATGSETRRWGTDLYGVLAARLAKECKLRSVLVGSSKDIDVCDDVAASFARAGGPQGQGFAPVSLAGKTTLKELAAVLKRCAVQICGDTGSAHIAAALNVPTVGLYGPTDPAYAGPWGQSGNVLAHRDLCGAGCGVRRCTRAARAACLAAITPGEVLEKVSRVLNEPAERFA